MFNKLCVVLVAAFAVQASLAAPKYQQGENIGGNTSSYVENDVTETQRVSQALSSQSEEFLRNLENLINKFRAEIDKQQGSVNSLLQQISGRLNATIGTLNEAVGPEVTAKRAEELRAQLYSQFKGAAVEFDRLIKGAETNLQEAEATVNGFAQGVLGDLLKMSDDLKRKVCEALEVPEPKSRTMMQYHPGK